MGRCQFVEKSEIKTRFVMHAVVAFLLVLLLSLSSLAQRETVDRIAAVVGKDIILASELANQIQLTALQTGRRPKTEKELNQFTKEVLEQMISDRLFLIEAKKDTSIVVRRSEVEQALQDQIARVVSNYDSEEAFLNALAAEGMTLRDLERQYYPEIENNLLRQRFIQKKLYSVSVSKYDVEKFYEEFKDSIPDQPEGVKLAHILFEYKPSKTVEDSVLNLATELRQKILDGADFAEIASTYSSFGAGANGGDLGYIERNDVVPEFARAAFKLKEGEISGVVRTQFGYHVIRCEGVRGDQLRLRHFLLGVTPTAQDSLNVIALADSVKTEIENGVEFEEMAKIFSDDDETRAQGGELGWFALSNLPEEFAPAVVGWTEIGSIRGPIKSRFGVHLLKLLDHQEHKKLTLKDDYDQIKELARQDKTGKMVDKWITEIKEHTYIEYRLDEDS